MNWAWAWAAWWFGAWLATFIGFLYAVVTRYRLQKYVDGMEESFEKANNLIEQYQRY